MHTTYLTHLYSLAGHCEEQVNVRISQIDNGVEKNMLGKRGHTENYEAKEKLMQ